MQKDMFGWCFRVTRKDELSIRDSKSLIVLQTLKDGVYFTTVTQRGLATQRAKQEEQYTIVQQKLVVAVMGAAVTYRDQINYLNHFVTELDCFFGIALASLHANVPFTRPELLPMGSGVLEFNEARHPCVEASMNGAFIPNSINMEHEANRFQIITGPNMGGK